MIFIDGEFDNLIIRLREQLEDLLVRFPDVKNEKDVEGEIGEKFVGYCIGHSLWKLGYTLDLKPYPRSYFLIQKYGRNADGHGGMDYLLTIVDEKEVKHRILIEVKNWAHYNYIPPEMFRNKILSRFTRVDSNREYPWVVTMNTRNIHLIESRCQRHNIHILPMEEHITPLYMDDDCVLIYLFRRFIDVFCTFITSTVPEDVYPYLIVENKGGERRTAGVLQDLMMGVSYDVIILRYGVSRKYIMRMASYIRSFGIPLPDRRNPKWQVQWEIQD